MAFGQNFISFMKKSVTYWTFVKLKNRKWRTYFIGKAINLLIFCSLKKNLHQKDWLETFQIWFISIKKRVKISRYIFYLNINLIKIINSEKANKIWRNLQILFEITYLAAPKKEISSNFWGLLGIYELYEMCCTFKSETQTASTIICTAVKLECFQFNNMNKSACLMDFEKKKSYTYMRIKGLLENGNLCCWHFQFP